LQRTNESNARDQRIHSRLRPFAFCATSKGALAVIRPDDLLAGVIRALVARSGLSAAQIEDVLVGCAFPDGEQGLNLGRIVGLLAGVPQSAGGVTINRWCGSSMNAIQLAAGSIAMGAGDLFLAGGVESMSRVPMMGFNTMPNPTWTEDLRRSYLNMGITAENLAKRYDIDRATQDQFALASHKKAAAAREDGRLAQEIVAAAAPGGNVTQDSCIRPDASAEKLATLKPAFLDGGSVTAGNSSPLTDGASATLIASEAFVISNGLKPLAQIKSYAISGCAPEIMGIGPVEATRKAIKRAGITVADLDVIEMNEAFAAQVLACCRDLDIDQKRLNRDGGAIALGHPLGATGARLVGKAGMLLKRDGGRYGLATQCIGGGQGIAMIMEAV
jgi:acetyl-CoA acyltransferase